MKRPGRESGFTLVELIVVLGIVAVLLGMSYTSWRGHVAQRELQYGTVQVASDLREAQERAKEARVVYTVTFTASSSTYVIARSGGGFLENGRLPDGVVLTANQVVTFSAFGQPDAAHTLTVQNSTGSGTISVTGMGGISYQTP